MDWLTFSIWTDDIKLSLVEIWIFYFYKPPQNIYFFLWLNHAYEFSESKNHKKFIWDIKCSNNYDLFLIQRQKKWKKKPNLRCVKRLKFPYVRKLKRELPKANTSDIFSPIMTSRKPTFRKKQKQKQKNETSIIQQHKWA